VLGPERSAGARPRSGFYSCIWEGPDCLFGRFRVNDCGRRIYGILRRLAAGSSGSFLVPPTRNPLRVLDFDMPSKRVQMTARVVPLHSQAADEARVGGTAAERLALVAELSRHSWVLTGRPFPAYARETIPVLVSRLGARPDRD